MKRMANTDMGHTAEEIDALLKSGSLERLGMGARRACYRLSGTNLCVKCYRSDAEIAEGKYPEYQIFKPLPSSVIREIQRYRFDEKHNTCCQEYRYWLSLRKRIPADLMAVFPSTMEQVLLPSRGWAVVEELIANADGTPPRKFAEVWCAYSDGDASVSATRDFLRANLLVLANSIIGHAIRFYDHQNILVQDLSDDSCRLRITDFEPGSRMLVPIDAIPAFARLKVRRRFARYMQTFGISSHGEEHE